MQTHPGMIPARVVIYVRDVRNVSGLGESAARAVLHKIRQAVGKKPGQWVTLDEFCKYTGIKKKIVREFMKG